MTQKHTIISLLANENGERGAQRRQTLKGKGYRLRLPDSLYQDLTLYAKIRRCSLAEEIEHLLRYSLEHNAHVMRRDRLMRLIYARSLAYTKPTSRKTQPHPMRPV